MTQSGIGLWLRGGGRPAEGGGEGQTMQKGQNDGWGECGNADVTRTKSSNPEGIEGVLVAQGGRLQGWGPDGREKS